MFSCDTWTCQLGNHTHGIFLQLNQTIKLRALTHKICTLLAVAPVNGLLLFSWTHKSVHWEYCIISLVNIQQQSELFLYAVMLLHICTIILKQILRETGCEDVDGIQLAVFL